jgi:hypothetical protein
VSSIQTTVANPLAGAVVASAPALGCTTAASRQDTHLEFLHDVLCAAGIIEESPELLFRMDYYLGNDIRLMYTSPASMFGFMPLAGVAAPFMLQASSWATDYHLLHDVLSSRLYLRI